MWTVTSDNLDGCLKSSHKYPYKTQAEEENGTRQRDTEEEKTLKEKVMRRS
jgi:hypothetical protein